MNKNDIKEVNKFAYLGGVVTNTSGVLADGKIHIHNTNATFIQLYQLWKARKISTATMLKIFRNVKSVLHGCKTWKVIKRIRWNLHLETGELGNIFSIFWSSVISNEELLVHIQEPVTVQTKLWKWEWTRHTLRKDSLAIQKEAYCVNPET